MGAVDTWRVGRIKASGLAKDNLGMSPLKGRGLTLPEPGRGRWSIFEGDMQAPITFGAEVATAL